MTRALLISTLTASIIAGYAFPSLGSITPQASQRHSSLSDELAEAVATRDATRVAELLNQGADPNHVPKGGLPMPVLALAVLRSDAAPDAATARAVVRQLKSAGAVTDPSGGVGATAMAMVALLGTANDVDLLIEVWPDLNVRGPNGATFVMLAADSANLSLTRTLISRGADPCLTDDAGQTAADYARRAADHFRDSRAADAAELESCLRNACLQRRPN
jgi:ankyrin repeat protein